MFLIVDPFTLCLILDSLLLTFNFYMSAKIFELDDSVGRYQYFTSGIRYYKFKTVFSISRYFGLVQIHKLHLIIGIFAT